MNEKIKGVHLDKNRNKWVAYMYVNKKRKHLGSFDTYEEAVDARKEAEIKYGFVTATPSLKLKHKNDLTQNELKERLHYDPETGDFTRLVSRGKSKAGSIAGSPDNNGYIIIGIDNKVYKAHRLVFLYMDGKFPEDEMDVDHINHKTSDNRWGNLRIATRQDNQRNQSIHKTNSSGYAGVRRNNRGKIWRAEINVNGEKKYLGSFNTYEEAVSARKQAEIKYGYHENHGKLNQIKEVS